MRPSSRRDTGFLETGRIFTADSRPVHEPFDVSFNVAQDGVCWTDAVLHADFFSPALPDHSGATNGLFVTNYHPAKVIGCSDDVTGDFCTRWNERESTWRKSWPCRSRGTNQSRSCRCCGGTKQAQRTEKPPHKPEKKPRSQCRRSTDGERSTAG